MKSFVRFLSAFLIFSFFANAQETSTWPEMDAFHDVMSQTWHPIEEGNYEPIHARSNELAEAAAAWKKSDIPGEYKAVKDIKKKLKELATETKELNKEITKGCSDEEIKEDMEELHELFHDIVGLCKE